MNKKILISIIVILILAAGIGAYFIFQKPQPPIGKCGDGVCDEFEKANPNLCPEDCKEEPSPTTTPSSYNQKLLVFYVIHVHGPEDIPEFQSITYDQFKRTAEVVMRIAQTLEKHGYRGTFEFLQNVADAATSYESQYGSNLLKDLDNKGYEVGVHAHSDKNNQWRNTKNSILKAGISKVYSIGGRAFGYNPDNRLDTGFKLAADEGYSIVTDNYAPSDKMGLSFYKDCTSGPGGYENNLKYSETGAFIHPWKPDYNDDVCDNDPDGKILYLDHVGGDWMKDASGSMTTLSSYQFDNNLKPKFQKALQYVASDKLTTWGFVSHEVNYLGGTTPHRGTEKINESAIQALDDFLAYLDQYKNNNQIEWLTAKEISSR